MIQTAIVGFGNVGKAAYEAVQNAPDMAVRCIVGRPNKAAPPHLSEFWATDIKDIRAHGDVDVALLCLPTRQCPDAAETLLKMGVRTVDAYDIHTDIWKEKCRLDAVAKAAGTACVLAAGWDPGTDSIVRTLMEAMAPCGITYTDFGPGMSMGHTVAAKAVEGVENALSMTIPAGTGVHRRMVYVQLKPGAAIEDVTRKILQDPYFAHDETYVRQVEDVAVLLDVGHGVHMTRRGGSGGAHNQVFEFTMRVNNPALTGQVLAIVARAIMKQAPGCYTMPELPVIDMLPGDREALIRRLV